MSSHILVVPCETRRVEGPGRYGPKKSKRSWCDKKTFGHLYDAEKFYAALMSPVIDWEKAATDPYSQTGLFYEPYWDFACEECAKRLGWIEVPE